MTKVQAATITHKRFLPSSTSILFVVEASFFLLTYFRMEDKMLAQVTPEDHLCAGMKMDNTAWQEL